MMGVMMPHRRAAECENFLKLCKCKYYNYSLFHRVVVGGCLSSRLAFISSHLIAFHLIALHLIVHRIAPPHPLAALMLRWLQTNFVAQTGDPKGTGEGGESVWGLIYGEKSRFFPRDENNRSACCTFPGARGGKCVCGGVCASLLGQGPFPSRPWANRALRRAGC